jgi:hypothetical protein
MTMVRLCPVPPVLPPVTYPFASERRDGNLLPMLSSSLKHTFFVALIFLAVTPSNADAPKKRPINLDDLARLQRVGPPVVSPNGEWVVYTVVQVDIKEDKAPTHLWMVKWDGSVRIQLTYGKDAASAPRFSPDGRYISFMSGRPGTAKGDQVWVMDRRGGEAEQLTNITDQNASPQSRARS